MAICELQGRVVPVKLWTQLHEVEATALTQLQNIASLPWVVHHVAAMPDVHLGKGATVGAVVAMRGAVAPAAVGVDIGCGMAAVRTSITANQLPDNLRLLRLAIEADIPVGFEGHEALVWDELSQSLQKDGHALMDRFGDLTEKVQSLETKAGKQVGTLGGGNHFIELCLDDENAVWLMLHSGSRNIGKSLAEVHIQKAKRLSHNKDLPDADLAVFLVGTREMTEYRRDLYWAQEYAWLNRRAMLELCQQVLRNFWPDIRFQSPVLCHHNYVAEEVHFGESLFITRKGAIRAGRGDLGIIPGSMGTCSYIVRGLGNAESFESASHGAGRRMSRTAARRRFSPSDLEMQTQGVECRKDRGVIDEIPGAYKDIHQVMANQRDLVEIVAELKQILCVKG
jgi:tRNA-splicing ligase RtcB